MRERVFTRLDGTEPASLTAGFDWAWDIEDPAHAPRDGWVLKYALRGPGSLDLTATDSGTTHEIRVPASASAALPAGSYRWIRYAERGLARVRLGEGRVTIEPDFLALTDGRSHAERALEAINAKLEGRLSKDVEEFQIDGKQVRRIPIPELWKLKARYEDLVRQEQGGAQGFFSSVEVEFVQPY